MADVIMIPETGLAIITNRMIGAGTEPHWIHWGTGTTAPVVGNTQMETPGPEARTVGTASRDLTNVANDTFKVVGTIICTTASKAITEVGLFDALTVGNLFLRGTFSAINVNVGDSIEFTIKAVFDQG